MMYAALFIVCALILFIAGILVPYKLLRQSAYFCASGSLAYFIWCYTFTNILHPHYWLRLNSACVTILIVLITAYIFAYYYQRILTVYENSIVPRILRLLIAMIGYIWVRANIIIWFDPVQQPGFFLARIWGDYDTSTVLVRTHFTNVVLTIYYALYAIGVAFAAFLFKDKWLWYLSILFSCVAFGKLLLMIMAMPNIAYRIFAFLLVGFLLITGSLIHQRFIGNEK